MNEFPKKYDPKEIEPRIQKFWEENAIFKFDPASDKPTYSIDTPPPTLSGYIHMGHVLSYSQAEFVARYQRMRGKNVFYPMGFDDNGLPTERFVEKKYKVNVKKLGREEFVRLCLKETEIGGANYRNVWTTLGISVDWGLLYSTINRRCQRISQRSFLDLYRQGRMERRNEPAIWCPVCQTSLAQADVEDSEPTPSLLNTIRFAADDGRDLWIATSRPELLASCVGLLVHPADGRYRDLAGKSAVTPIFNARVPILADAKVDPAFGTGMVMVCTFGDKTDIDWWRQFDLPLRLSIEPNGTMGANAGPYQGMKIDACRRKILEDLGAAGLLREQKPIVHVMNVHDRCGTPVEFNVTPQWFIRILDIKDELLAQGARLKWYPGHMKIRYDTWIQGLKWDWCISRQRYFGVPFPIWYCRKCGAVAIAEDRQLPVDPLADRPLHPCTACGGTEFEPEKDVMDTWATSSATPLINANWGEPDSVIDTIYPMNMRPQSHEIIRTWLFYTVIKSYLHTQSLPWKDVMISGQGLDPNGKAMHKSTGNIIEPLPIVQKYSADAVRWWAASAKLGDDLAFKEKEVVYGQKFINKLFNASRLAAIHIGGYEPSEPRLELIDRWLLTKLDAVVREATENFERYEYSKAKSLTEQFFRGDFCDNYLEIAKDRLYRKAENGASGQAAVFTVYTALLGSLKLLAPFIPHITEDIYQRLFREYEGSRSLHASPWPAIAGREDADALRLGDMAVALISCLRQYKNSQNMAQNATLARATISADGLEGDVAKIADVLRDAMKIGGIACGPVESPDAACDVEGREVRLRIEK